MKKSSQPKKYFLLQKDCQGKKISSDFFNRPAVKTAKNMLGKILMRRFPAAAVSKQNTSARRETALIITEVEIYDGFQDKASHASIGKTERNKIMFGSAGIFYVYFTYGMHWMLNVVVGPKNYPAAILIRSGVVINKSPNAPYSAVNGPARLTKLLKIDKSLNGLPADRKTGLWLEDWGIKIKPSQITAKKRVGIDRVPRYWRDKKYNFSVSL